MAQHLREALLVQQLLADSVLAVLAVGAVAYLEGGRYLLARLAEWPLVRLKHRLRSATFGELRGGLGMCVIVCVYMWRWGLEIEVRST